MLTKEKLMYFIKIRNNSPFTSNLQFEIDCDEAGFDINCLGNAKKVKEGIYAWDTPYGTLIEEYGKLRLE